MKRVFLVRHAESVENERLAALKQFGNDLYEFKVPFWTDFSKGAGLLAVPDPIDTPLSDSGIAQVEQVADKLHQDSFFQTREIDLVVHSPLSRAKDTCLGLVREESIEIQEWDCLREKFVSEWIPGNGVGLDIRIQEFENRLLQLPHKNIFVVGHSQYFKKMLKMENKFSNVDIYEVVLEEHVETKLPNWRDPIKRFSVEE